MNAIRLSRQLREGFVRYLMTTFDVGKQPAEQPLAAALRRALDAPGALFQGPYLELTPPYRTGKNLRQLVEEGVLTSRLTDLPCFGRDIPLPPDLPLYFHQESSIRRVVKQRRNLVVASGTGSGKTETFLIPILDDLLRDQTPGVRAVLIYPMNALVNDQLDRLRAVLAGTQITFGRYTSELAETEADARRRWASEEAPLPNEIISRQTLRGDPSTGVPPRVPQILITNYAMLEYLLLRPQDATIFDSGLWRFICLDEAHTYSGAQGIEVGLLLRRLKHRLHKKPGEVRCIATSATLTRDDSAAAADFAHSLFGEEFTPEDVVFGELNDSFAPGGPEDAAPDPRSYLALPDGLISDLRNESIDLTKLALTLEEAGVIEGAVADKADRMAGGSQSAFLWHAMAGNPHLRHLRSWMRQRPPATLKEAGRELFPDLASEDAELAAHRMVELGAIARPKAGTAALLPARYHLFARPPQGAWVCLNPDCPGKDSPPDAAWSRLFTQKRETCDACGSVVYGISICRTCGQPYLAAYRKDGQLSPDPTFPGSAEGREYFTWSRLDPESVLAADEDGDGAAESPVPEEQGMQICLHCRREVAECSCTRSERKVVTVFRLTSGSPREVGDGRGGRAKKASKEAAPLSILKRCRRCGTERRGEGAEVVTPLTVGGNTPLAVLTEELYRSLPPSPDPAKAAKPGRGRKLLTFSDSRQGAARYAAYLQDTVNGNLYRHLVVESVRRLNGKGRKPDVESLAEETVDLCDQYGVYATDLDIESSSQMRPGQWVPVEEKRRRLREAMARVLGEFATRPMRHSLTSTGLVGCDYFDGSASVAELAGSLGVSTEAAGAIASSLLDTMRHDKAISLPDGVAPDHLAFGVQQGMVRYKQSGAATGRGEANWTGEGPKQARWDYMRRVLQRVGRPCGETDVRRALGAVWEWLQGHETRLLVGSAAQGYQLNWQRLVLDASGPWYRCDRCLKLTRRGASGFDVCPTRGCDGHLAAADPAAEMDDDHYRRIFARPPVGLRVEEHTAQLESSKGQEYQDAFKAGDINILSCSTTFELGVDLGELQAVVLNNVPPTVANYRQRAGRAGRRADGTAFILTFAAERPHDQVFFADPPAIISGEVRIPRLALENMLIAQRHLNALLLGHLLRHLAERPVGDIATVGAFFDPAYPGGCHFDRTLEWRETAGASVEKDLARFRRYFDAGEAPDKTVERFLGALGEQSEYVATTLQGYQAEIEYWGREVANPYREHGEDPFEMMKRFHALAGRIRDERLIDYLSSAGILPSYSFPINVVRLNLPPFDRHAKELRLERDLRQAIIEYAPGADVVADKRIWRSGGLEIRKTPKDWTYRICKHCNHLEKQDVAGRKLDSDACPVCGQKPPKRDYDGFKYIKPDGFQTNWGASGKPAGQHVERPQNRSRSVLWSRGSGSEEALADILRYAYRRNGELLAVNSGPNPDGFRLCWTCGAQVAKGRTDHRTPFGKRCSNPSIHTAHLGHSFQTDTLHLRFAGAANFAVPSPEDLGFWHSLMYALLQGASRSLQIERRDLDGVLAPYREAGEEGWHQEIVLFDNVPSGAGHVRRIAEHFKEVLDQALLVANCSDCAPETSCCHCLRDYSNQLFHDELRRGPVAQFIETLSAHVYPARLDHLSPGAVKVIAANRGKWLDHLIAAAAGSVWIAARRIEVGAVKGDHRGWLDIVQDLLSRGRGVHLWTEELPASDTVEGLGLRRHLQLLVSRYGLELRQTSALPTWHIVIDEQEPMRCRAVHLVGEPVLGEGMERAELATTTRAQEVSEALAAFRHLSTRLVAAEELDPPPSVRVHYVEEGQRTSVRELLGDSFRLPLEGLEINDRYLHDARRVACLKEYLRLVRANGSPVSVRIRTLKASATDADNADDATQEHLFLSLKEEFPNLSLDYRLSPFKSEVPHDRFLVLRREGGQKARITIGAGLDFLRDGRAKATIIVQEYPWKGE